MSLALAWESRGLPKHEQADLSEFGRRIGNGVVGFRALTLALSCGLAGCGAPTAPSNTALVGTVVRGPVQPVCQVNVPCEAPFSASFTVERGNRVVAAFRSDSDGHFEVRLAGGMYLVVPGPDAPIISPRSQAKEVAVDANGTTTVLLQFDTGIR